jgi:UDP-N-acetylglucosamine 2-epimerase (non-hydrolysing)
VRLVGTVQEKIVNSTLELLENSKLYKNMSESVNPYGDGKAAPRIVAKIAEAPLSGRLLVKRFHDLAIGEELK